MKRLITKKYIRVTFQLTSPLSIGSGKNQNTDSDIMLDNSGKPFIPGSALAGVLREAVAETGRMDSKELDQYFGVVKINTEIGGKKDQLASESRIVFYDAVLLPGESFVISQRDGVALDEYKTAVPGAKFDMEIIEPGPRFETFLVQNVEEGEALDVLELLSACFLEGNVSFGAKTMRGMGEIRTEEILSREFDMTKADDVVEWVDFSIYDPWDRQKCTSISSAVQGRYKAYSTLCLALRLEGGISIRRYTTQVSNNRQAMPDYEQLTVNCDIPVIPGTSWAGAFRHHMSTLMGGSSETWEAVRDTYFGYVKGKEGTDKARSRISFSESKLIGGKSKVISRNAIDRFSGGAADTALFTEKTYYGGKTELVIRFRIPDTRAYEEDFLRLLSACVADLHGGYMAIGGLTAVGRGLFTVVEIDGERFDGSPEDLYKKLLAHLRENLKEIPENVAEARNE